MGHEYHLMLGYLVGHEYHLMLGYVVGMSITSCQDVWWIMYVVN